MSESPLPLSVFIITLNEADRIAQTIRSIKPIADEIIVVDSGSTDNTMQVAEQEGGRVFFHAWKGYGPQKRYAEQQCQHDWLLNLDADEIASPKLLDEIRALFNGLIAQHSGYTVRIYNMLSGEKSLPIKTQVNTCLRLYNKHYAQFSDSPVHDSVIVKKGTTVGALTQPVYHPSFRSLDHAMDKLNRYSTMQAKDMLDRDVPIPLPRLLVEFPANFIKAYFFRGYIFRGMRGFSYAMTYAFFRFARLAKWHEMRRHKETRP